MMLLTAPAFSSYVLAPSARTRASVPMMSLSGEEELLSKFGVPAPEEFKTTRREALGLGATLGVAATMPFLGAAPAVADDGMFSVPPLPYAYDAWSRLSTCPMKVSPRRCPPLPLQLLPPPPAAIA